LMAIVWMYGSCMWLFELRQYRPAESLARDGGRAISLFIAGIWLCESPALFPASRGAPRSHMPYTARSWTLSPNLHWP
jgi:hypothetical protein